MKILRLNTPDFRQKDFAGRHYRFYNPLKSNPSYNIKKKYPLIIYLHGASERGTDNRRQSYDLSFIGNSFGKEAQQFRKQYPCFVYIPQCPKNKDWNDQLTLDITIKTIESILSIYPIDRERLYLIGYSMGGSGTYSLSTQYYKYNKSLFAGIIRLAGQGNFPDETHQIIAKSSIWLHVGLKDTNLRIKKAREAYSKIKDFHNAKKEDYIKTDIPEHTGSTRTLITNDKCFSIRLTEYEQDGHSISHFPFKDTSLMPWLFKQKTCQ